MCLDTKVLPDGRAWYHAFHDDVGCWLDGWLVHSPSVSEIMRCQTPCIGTMGIFSWFGITMAKANSWKLPYGIINPQQQLLTECYSFPQLVLRRHMRRHRGYSATKDNHEDINTHPALPKLIQLHFQAQHVARTVALTTWLHLQSKIREDKKKPERNKTN